MALVNLVNMVSEVMQRYMNSHDMSHVVSFVVPMLQWLVIWHDAFMIKDGVQ